MPNERLVISQDGSHTIHSEKFGVSYHSKYGAVQETQTVFIDAGLKFKLDGISDIYILEMGFGTGLNAIMTFMHDHVDDVTIHYHTLEAYPISESEAKALNYPIVLEMDAQQQDAFYKMHTAKDGETIQLRGTFHFVKHIQKIEDFRSQTKYDLIYYDAFAPTSQEHLWTDSMMQHLAAMAAPECCLVTYCAKGSFKRALKAASFQVEGLPGPVGKREMTRATFMV